MFSYGTALPRPFFWSLSACPMCAPPPVFLYLLAADQRLPVHLQRGFDAQSGRRVDGLPNRQNLLTGEGNGATAAVVFYDSLLHLVLYFVWVLL